MKSCKLIFAALAATSLITLPASAQQKQVERAAFYPHWYGNVHLARVDTSLVEATQDFTYTNLGFGAGYQFSELFSAEFMGTFAISGERDEIVSDLVGTNVDTQYAGLGGYLVGKTPGQFYAKGRFGLAMSQFSYTSDGFDDEREADFGLSFGVGVGLKIDTIRVDLDYYVMPDVDDPVFEQTSYETTLVALSVGYGF